MMYKKDRYDMLDFFGPKEPKVYPQEILDLGISYTVTGGSEGEKWGAIPRATAEWRRSLCDEVEIHTKK